MSDEIKSIRLGPAAVAAFGELQQHARERPIVAPRFHRLVVDAYAGEKRLIALRGAYHNDPIQGAALANLNDALGWLLEENLRQRR